MESNRNTETSHPGRSRSAFKRELMHAPSTSWKSYVFPWDKVEQNYCISSYNSSLSEGRVSQTQVERLIHELRQSAYYQPSRPWFAAFSIFVSMLLVAVLFAICESSADKSHATAWRVIFSVYFVIGTAAVAGLIFGSRRRNSKRVTELKRIIQEQQNGEFAAQNVLVTLSEHGAYIEIKFTWKDQITGGPVDYDLGSPMVNPSSQPPGSHSEKDHRLNPEHVRLNVADERTPHQRLQGDKSPPQVQDSPVYSQKRHFEVPIRNIEIPYSPESRGMDVRQQAVQKSVNIR